MKDMNPNRRTELAGFLRARRARLSPRQVGLPDAGPPGRRRTPGLRRQEVAQLAGLSVDYYIRLEQARGPHPSRQVLGVVWSDADFVRFTRSTVADLRAAYARYPGDPGIDSLVTEMLALSPRFAQMWAEHEVEVRGPMLKHVPHPRAGPLEFECQVLHIAETGQRLIAYCAAPGSATEAAFAEMAARAPLTA
jgi:MmyB-like transcription regulator ligand binding domain/Helix-turn-helix domain